MTDASPILSLREVSYAYEPHLPPVLSRVSFDLAPGSFTVIVGPSGGGKSTLLRLAAKLVAPSSGAVENRARTRMIFQNAALLPWLSALDNVLLGTYGLALSRKEAVARAQRALADLGLAEHGAQLPRELSGGQRQRVGIARALVSEPELLLLDEPFSALDVETASALADEVLKIHADRGITMLMVSHSIDDAAYLADRVLVCARGGIAAHVDIALSRPRDRQAPAFASLAGEIRRHIPSS